MIFIWLTLWTLLTTVRFKGKETPDRDPEIGTLVAAVVAVLASIFVAGNTADFLMAEGQFWMLAALVSMLRFAGSKAPGEAPTNREVVYERPVNARFGRKS